MRICDLDDFDFRDGGPVEAMVIFDGNRSVFLKWRGADAEIVETFDGDGEEHGWRKVEN